MFSQAKDKLSDILGTAIQIIRNSNQMVAYLKKECYQTDEKINSKLFQLSSQIEQLQKKLNQ